MNEAVWRPLSYESVKKFASKPGSLFCAAAPDGHAYVGTIDSVTDRYLELRNGPHREILYYKQRPGMRYTLLEAPPGITFGVGDATLPLED